MKTDLFQSCGRCWVFQICWYIECNTFTASSFRIWKSSAGIPSPPIAFFAVMLLKAQLICTPGCLALGEWSHHQSYLVKLSIKIFFVQFFCVFLPPLLNIFCFCYVHTISFLSFIVPIFAWNIPPVSLIFLKQSLASLSLLFSSISLHWSLRKALLSFLAILWNSAFRWIFKKQQLEPDMEQRTGSKLGKEYVKAIYCHPAYLAYMQSTSSEMPDWMKHKLESRLPGEISITSDMQMAPSLWQKVKKN